MAQRVLRIDLEIESDEELSALRGALLAARGAERAEMQRRGARHAFGYGTESAREGMTAEAAQAARRWALIDRLVTAVADPAKATTSAPTPDGEAGSRDVIPLLACREIVIEHDFLVDVLGFASAGLERTPDGAVVHAEVRLGS